MTIYDLFGLIVADVEEQLNIDISYMWGHPIEVSEILEQLSKMPTKAAKKYPLIALFTDVPEAKGNARIEAEIKLHLIIAVNTLQSYSSSQRLEKNFTPTLYPIYDQLLKSICYSGYFVGCTPGDLEHTKTDRFRYGKTGIYANSAEIFKDKIDCIEIENLKLLKRFANCKITNL